jgi:hypothetical protein
MELVLIVVSGKNLNVEEDFFIVELDLEEDFFTVQVDLEEDFFLLYR